MTKLKLMADYQCFPVWRDDEGQVGNVDPRTLPISESLKTRLLVWAKTFDSTLNEDDPLSSGFSSDQAESEFKKDGKALGVQLQDELGPAYFVEVKI